MSTPILPRTLLPQTDRGRTPEVLVVTHTHWDREWYRTAEEFRLALVCLVDEVLEGQGGDHFLLDGQAIVLEDYLTVRPHRREEVVSALREGALEAGPWYVLGDTLIPGGEAMVRNLLVGRGTMRTLGAAPPPVLYCPDSFGHSAVLPTLAAGFGAPLIVLWRGYGGARWPAGDTVRWRARDGAEALVFHLPPDGYEFGSNLPPDPADAAARWQRLHDTLLPRSTLGVLVVQNGADHHAVQERLGDALAALARAASPVPVRATSLAGVAEELLARAACTALPVVAGELRDSTGYVWSLQGTLGTRAQQKRANAMAERLLVRDAEPWTALARWAGRGSRRDDLTALWRVLLACHPHDTLCGCSIDAVAAAMDERLAVVRRGSALVGERARLAVLGHDAVAAQEAPGRWRHLVVVRNGAPRWRSGVAELEVEVPLADVPVGPASAGVAIDPGASPVVSIGDPALPLQLVSRERAFSRVESPRHYPRNALVERRRYLAWVAAAPPLSLEALPVVEGGRRTPVPAAVRVDGGAMRNELLRLRVHDGGLQLEMANGRTFADILGFEDEGERGDLYTHSAIPATATVGRLVSHRVTARGPLRAELTTMWSVLVQARSLVSATGEPVRHPRSTVRVEVRIQLDAGARVARLVVRVDNRAPDHRLRLVVRSRIERPAVWCDAAFGEIRRVTSAELPPGDSREAAVPTAPLHGSVSCFASGHGLTLLGDGLAEYEARDDGSIAVTLLRATGELSRHDLPERPGHAGWPAATPGAQMPGTFEACFALFPHGGRTDEVRVAIDECREDFLVPLAGASWRSALEVAEAIPSVALEGEGLAFCACKESEDGNALVLRCRNLLDRAVDGAWRLAGLEEAQLARLDESPIGELPTCEDRVRFRAEPNAVVTILVRGALPVPAEAPNA